MKQGDVLTAFREAGALLEGHFRLSSGLHSPQYVQCAKVLQYPRRASVLCAAIADHARGLKVDAVVAPAIGGIVVAQEVARQLDVRSMFAERKDGAMQLRRGFGIAQGERILLCEDVVTTGGSVREVMELVQRLGASVAAVCAIVDRGGGASLPGFFSIVSMPLVTYESTACPLCRDSVPIETPGSRTAR